MLLLSRKDEHGDKAIMKIKESVKEPVDIEFISCDLGNLAEVKSVADQVRNDEKRLDIVNIYCRLFANSST